METTPETVERDNAPIPEDGRLELTCGSIAAVVIAAAVWGESGSLLPLAWLLVAQLVYGTRIWLMRKSADRNASTSKRSVRYAIAVSATGFLWGAATASCLIQFGMTWITSVVLATVAILVILVLGCYLVSKNHVIPFAVAAAVPPGMVGLLA